MNYPVIFETEDNGAISAYVAGVPGVYAAADTRAQAERSITWALKAHLRALAKLGKPLPVPRAEVRVLKVRGTAKPLRVDMVGAGALLGARTSATKAASSRANGAKGGRPRKTVAIGR